MRVGGESNRSLSRIVSKSREDYRALKKNGVGGVGALVWKNLSKVGSFFSCKSGALRLQGSRGKEARGLAGGVD